MNNIVKFPAYETNEDFFVNTILKTRLDYDINDISLTHASREQFKKLTIDILTATKDTGSKYGMKYISSIIDKWKDSIVRKNWEEELLSFCLTHDDIEASMLADDEGRRVFIIVMDDSTSDNVLDYNEFGFKLKEKYRNDIDDFMILDKITANGVEDLLNDVITIYKRG